MAFLIDTNIIIFALKDTGKQLAEKLSNQSFTSLHLSSIVQAELFHGAEKYGNPERRKQILSEFLTPYHRIPFDSHCVPHYARIRHHLEKQGTVIGNNDLLIASTALAYDLTLITHNCVEFARVPGLKWEDWS